MFTLLADAMYRDILKKTHQTPSKKYDCRARRARRELEGHRHLW